MTPKWQISVAWSAGIAVGCMIGCSKPGYYETPRPWDPDYYTYWYENYEKWVLWGEFWDLWIKTETVGVTEWDGVEVTRSGNCLKMKFPDEDEPFTICLPSF